MGEVLQYSPATWMTLKMVKQSIDFYKESRDNNRYGTALRKEKAIFDYLAKDTLT